MNKRWEQYRATLELSGEFVPNEPQIKLYPKNLKGYKNHRGFVEKVLFDDETYGFITETDDMEGDYNTQKGFFLAHRLRELDYIDEGRPTLFCESIDVIRKAYNEPKRISIERMCWDILELNEHNFNIKLMSVSFPVGEKINGSLLMPVFLSFINDGGKLKIDARVRCSMFISNGATFDDNDSIEHLYPSVAEGYERSVMESLKAAIYVYQYSIDSGYCFDGVPAGMESVGNDIHSEKSLSISTGTRKEKLETLCHSRRGHKRVLSGDRFKKNPDGTDKVIYINKTIVGRPKTVKESNDE